MLTQILSLDKFIFQSRPRYLKAEINLLKRKRNVTSTKTDLKYKYRNNFFFIFIVFFFVFISVLYSMINSCTIEYTLILRR